MKARRATDFDECAIDGCRREAFRQGVCYAHMKRRQRGQDVSTPIGNASWPGGLEPGEVLSPKEKLLKVAVDYVECDAEDDDKFKRTENLLVRTAIRLAESCGYVKAKDALDLAQSFGWQPPMQHQRARSRKRAHRRQRGPHVQLQFPFVADLEVALAQ